MHGKILTCDTLQKEEEILINRSLMCKGDSESMDNLLLHYQFARALGDLALSRLGISWVASLPMKNHLLTWEGFVF